jgi:hypothetical protein
MATLAVFLVDRLGRRKLLMIGAAGMTIAQAGQAALIKILTRQQKCCWSHAVVRFPGPGFLPHRIVLDSIHVFCRDCAPQDSTQDHSHVGGSKLALQFSDRRSHTHRIQNYRLEMFVSLQEELSSTD